MGSMARAGRHEDSTSRGDSEFAATRWSVVLAAGHRSSPDSRQALELLCAAYWYPLYTYVRRRVADVHQARDLTQEFFAVLLERNALNAADRERGRFRSFLLTSFKNFLADEWDKAKAQKRGGGQLAIPLDLESAESRYRLEPADELTPERLFERQCETSMSPREKSGTLKRSSRSSLPNAGPAATKRQLAPWESAKVRRRSPPIACDGAIGKSSAPRSLKRCRTQERSMTRFAACGALSAKKFGKKL
jgi:DNA-directed RNA polymerase specialized sigma24 family protein